MLYHPVVAFPYHIQASGSHFFQPYREPIMSLFSGVAIGVTILSQLCAPAAMAAPTTAETSGCKVQTGVTPPTFEPDLFNRSAKDVSDSVTAWLNDVCTVDSFLNNPKGKTSLATTIAFAFVVFFLLFLFFFFFLFCFVGFFVVAV